MVSGKKQQHEQQEENVKVTAPLLSRGCPIILRIKQDKTIICPEFLNELQVLVRQSRKGLCYGELLYVSVTC